MKPRRERIFYNKEQKEKYIETVPKNRMFLCERIFNGSYPLEKEKGKDLCDFTREEILELYSYLNVKTPSILRDINSVVRVYIKSQNKNDKALDDVDITLLRTKVNKVAIRVMLISREDLLKALARSKENPLYNPYDAFIILACFEGLENKNLSDIRDITIDDFYKKDKQYYAKLPSGRTVKVSDELYEYAKDSYLLTYRMKKHKNGTVIQMYAESEYRGGIVKFLPIRKEGSDELIERNKKKSMYRYIQHQIEISNLPKYLTTTKALRMSGILDYIKKRCAELQIDYDTFLTNNIEEVIEQYNFSNESTARRSIRDYLI